MAIFKLELRIPVSRGTLLFNGAIDTDMDVLGELDKEAAQNLNICLKEGSTLSLEYHVTGFKAGLMYGTATKESGEKYEEFLRNQYDEYLLKQKIQFNPKERFTVINGGKKDE